MSFVRRDVALPSHPFLLVGLEGWLDPGFAAATAIASLIEEIETRTWAVFDTDEYIDLRARRPRIRIEDGVRGRIHWPSPRLRVGVDGADLGVALLVGPEPDLRWKPFAAEVTSLAMELETPLVIGLGAYPAATPHTRPTSVLATGSDLELARRVGYLHGSWERPARMIDVIGEQCKTVGIPSIGIVASVPHYLGSAPYPAAAAALLETVFQLTGINASTEGLSRAAESSRAQIDELIAQSDEHIAMVKELERQYDGVNEAPLSESDLPSGEEIAAELERYLRGEH